MLNAVNILDAPLALALPFFSLISFTLDALFTFKHEQIQFCQVIFNFLHFTLILTDVEDILQLDYIWFITVIITKIRTSTFLLLAVEI